MKNHMTKFHEIFRTCYLYPWLVLLWRQLCNSGFLVDVVLHNGANGPKSSTTWFCLVSQVAKVRVGKVSVYDCRLVVCFVIPHIVD